MSENEEIMNETENETMAAEVEAVETVETKAAELPAVGIALDKYIHGCQTRRALIVMGGKVVSQ